MKSKALVMGAVFLSLGICTSNAFADTSLQDMRFNVNGVPSASTPTGVSLSSNFSTTGLGTITYTTTAAGSGYFNVWLDSSLGTPFYNEFGSTSGSPGAGESWEIGDSSASSIFTDAQNGALTNTNLLPEGASNYLGTCSGACNGDVSIALGDAFVLASGMQEWITVTASTSKPGGGFYLDQTHPVDPNNPNESDVYYTLTASQTPFNHNVTPEPGTWMLMLLGIGFLALAMRRRFNLSGKLSLGILMAAGLALATTANAQSVDTVPWDPTNFAAPHTAYAGANIVLGAIFNTAGSPDAFTYSWNFGDGSAATAAAPVTNPNDISATHIYPASTVGHTWTAVVTVTDTTTHAQYTGNYLVIWENNNLQSRVNVAIDLGLWYMHQSMNHPSATTGNWDSCASGFSFDCGLGYGSVTASNVQAFEVNGHLATGPATDPYTSDVKEGLDHIFTYLTIQSVQSKTYNFNTNKNNFGCSNGQAPSPGGTCPGGATAVYYNPTGQDCSGVCNFTFDGNSNGKAIFALQQGYSWGYEDGQYADAIVASGNPAGVATTGSVSGETYKDIVQDIADAAAFCQYGSDNDVLTGNTRGGGPSQGGGWWYNCQSGDDNSVSQWASIGLIAAERGFGLAIPKIVTDANNMWVTASQDVQAGHPLVNDPNDNDYTDAYGAFGYNGSLYYSDAWGPYAVTPSGMVQMSLDGIGRTANTAFGGASNAPDQRFNNAETYYADNFCNNPALGATMAPKAYTYGMFSFTKSMLLHNPGGVLSPIQYLRTQTPGVFTTNASIPANTIDWYAALSPANGGTDPCDGVAQTLVGRQNAAGYWFGDNYYSYQNYFETAWSIIMLQRTVFVNCVNNLGGKGTAAGTAAARIDLTWTGIPNVTGYDILRSSTNGGPYTQVGTTTSTAYSDRTGLTSGQTYYYVLQPVNGASSVCQSNQATVTIPNKR